MGPYCSGAHMELILAGLEVEMLWSFGPSIVGRGSGQSHRELGLNPGLYLGLSDLRSTIIALGSSCPSSFSFFGPRTSRLISRH